MKAEPYQFGPLISAGGADFRLWAPANNIVAVEIEGQGALKMIPGADGWVHAAATCQAGTRYCFRLADGRVVPDPASRWQPDGVHGPSVVVSSDYPWRRTDWRGRPWSSAIIYELHAGLCGGYRGIEARLAELVDLGITAIQLMPIAEFSGARNWGYDGVLPFAPKRSYGTPDELKALIDHAHSLGLMVFLDVVYNHFGPDGNWIGEYAPAFFRADRHTPWGAAIDFRQPAVSRFFLENALYWLNEFRFDGLRFDAVHTIVEQDWLKTLAQTIRAAVPPGRHIHLILENEANSSDLLDGMYDAQWNDDFHNVLHVLLTGETNSYYSDFATAPIQKLARCLSEGFIYQGDVSLYKAGKKRGMPSKHLSPAAFITFLQNHDQVGNRAFGDRLTKLVRRPFLEAAIALQLLCPQIPMLFMGEEVGAEEPFLFFTDFHGELGQAVRDGRRREFAGGAGFDTVIETSAIPDPNSTTTFEASRPDFSRQQADGWRDLYRRLLQCRRQWLGTDIAETRSLDARVIGTKAVIARWRLPNTMLFVIASNFDETSITAELPSCPPIWGAPSGMTLPAATTLAWIDRDDR